MQDNDIKIIVGTYPNYLFGLDVLYHMQKNANNFYTRLGDCYKDGVRIKMGMYNCWFLFHPHHIEQVLATHANVFIRFERIIRILRQWNGKSLLMEEGGIMERTPENYIACISSEMFARIW